MKQTSNKTTEIAYSISDRFESVNQTYIKTMASGVKKVIDAGSNINEALISANTRKDLDTINKKMTKETLLAITETNTLYESQASKIYKESSIYYKANNIPQVDFTENVDMQTHLNSHRNRMIESYVNISRTTVMSEKYKEAIDEAVRLSQSGESVAEQEIRKLLKAYTTGSRVLYASGLTRRLDSAVRMNILDGIRSLNMDMRYLAGLQFGADGVEIDAHSLCAPDHIDIQGEQYSIKDFEKLDDNLDRPIGTCNCQHGISYIILGVSPPTYTKEDLEYMRRYSEEKISIDDKKISRYDCSQKMRQLETAMRYIKDDIVALRIFGFSTDKEEARLKTVQAKYRQLSELAELKKRYNRAYVPHYKV